MVESIRVVTTTTAAMTSMYNPSVYQPHQLEPVRVMSQRRSDGSVPSLVFDGEQWRKSTASERSGAAALPPFVFAVDKQLWLEQIDRERAELHRVARDRRAITADVMHSIRDTRDKRRLREYELRTRANDLERQGAIDEARRYRKLADDSDQYTLDAFEAAANKL